MIAPVLYGDFVALPGEDSQLFVNRSGLSWALAAATMYLKEIFPCDVDKSQLYTKRVRFFYSHNSSGKNGVCFLYFGFLKKYQCRHSVDFL